jgi:hypothetical protein
MFVQVMMFPVGRRETHDEMIENEFFLRYLHHSLCPKQ